MAQLIAYVHISDDEGVRHVFAPGDELPDWAVERITNPKAWADGVPPSAPAGPSGGSGEIPSAGPVTAPPTAGVPPRSGAGSGLADWAAYAAGRGVDSTGLTRNQLIERLDAAGIPTR